MFPYSSCAMSPRIIVKVVVLRVRRRMSLVVWRKRFPMMVRVVVRMWVVVTLLLGVHELLTAHVLPRVIGLVKMMALSSSNGGRMLHPPVFHLFLI